MYYKLVSYYNGEYRSFTRTKGMEHSIEYKVGEVVKPTIGKILVFGNIDDAKTFYKKELACYNHNVITFFSQYRIFTCEVENPIPVKTLVSYAFQFQAFWSDSNLISPEFQFEAPTGSIGVDSCKLIAEINYEEHGFAL